MVQLEQLDGPEAAEWEALVIAGGAIFPLLPYRSSMPSPVLKLIALAVMPARARDLLERLHLHVESAYAAVDRRDLRVIHCDLWHDNIKLYRGALHPLDFEDTVWGFRAHDIAMAMLDLLEDTDEARYSILLEAFRRGYTAHMPWPDAPIEPFQAGRLLWKINWVARHQPQHLTGMVENYVPLLEHYERTGQILRPPSG